MKSMLFYLLATVLCCSSLCVQSQELILNGSFNDTSAHWFTFCTNVEANYFEPTYGGTNGPNRVAEIDDLTCTYQDVCILPSTSYQLSLLASRRSNAAALIITNIKAEGLDATGNIVGAPLIDVTFSRDNIPFVFTPVTGIPLITVPPGLGIVRLRIRFTDVTPAYMATGMIIDDVSLVFQPQPAHAGDTVTCINALSTHAITNLPGGTLYSWSFDSGSMPAISVQPSPSVYWTTNGTKTVACIISNAVCPVDTFLQLVTVGDPSIPGVVSPVHYCQGDTATALNATGANLLWYTSPTGGTGTPLAPVPGTAITGTTTWYVSRTEGPCESPRVALTVIVHQAVHADFTYDIQYDCLSDSVSFTNLSTGNGSYTWDFGDHTGSFLAHPAHAYPLQGLYIVKLVSQGGYCNDSLSRIMDLNHPLRTGFTADDFIVCEGSVIHFTDTSIVSSINGITPSYSWDFGDGHTAAIQNPEHTYAHPGAYRVQLRIQDFVPCTDTASEWVYVDSASGLRLVTGDTALCMGASFAVQGSFTRSGLLAFTCDFGDQTTAHNGSPAVHAYDRPGIYKVQAKASYRACPDTTLTLAVLVKSFPVLNLGTDTALCLNGYAISLSDQLNTANPAASWLWSNGDTTANTKITAPGVYKLRVTVDDCSTTEEIRVLKDCYADLPNAFTPNGDGTNDYFFPRQLFSRGVSRFGMKVFNRWGQVVFTTDRIDGRGWDGRFNGVMQPQGVYLYRIDIQFKNGAAEHYNGNVTLL